MQKGNIGVTTENIFPVIKKFLYSDHEIFLREIVSNAIDASQKLKTLANKGDFKGELGDIAVRVSLGKDTLTISDRGIGMTAEEIDKYINQIAFSGANDFLDKYKDTANAIIGHFGLGFYSAFMVSKKVEVITKSYKEGSKAVNGAATVVPNLNSPTQTKPIAVQTSCYILMMTARNSSKNHASRHCLTNIASSCLYLSPSEKRRNGKTASRWTLMKITSSTIPTRYGQRSLRNEEHTSELQSPD